MNVNDQKRFFQNIELDENGNMIIQIEMKANPLEKGVNQYNTFKKLTLTTEGYLKTHQS